MLLGGTGSQSAHLKIVEAKIRGALANDDRGMRDTGLDPRPHRYAKRCWRV